MRCSIYLSVMKSCRRKRKEALKSESRQDVIKERLAGMLLAKLGPANPPRHIVVTIGARSSVTHQIGLARMGGYGGLHGYGNDTKHKSRHGRKRD